MSSERAPSCSGARRPLHLPPVPRPVPYWVRLIPPGELPARAVIVRLVLALALATGLWIRISADQNPTETITYPTISPAVIPPPGYYPVQSAPRVSIQVQGLRSDLSDAPRPSASIDLRHFTPSSMGPYPVVVTGLPSGVELRGVTPSTVRLTWDRSATKSVAVQVLAYNSPPGFSVRPPTFSPRAVQITGPSHTVNAIVSARILVDESNFRNDQVLVRDPTIIDRNGQAVSRNIVRVVPRSVTVSVHVQIQPYQQTILVAPDITGTLAPGYRITSVTALPQFITVLSNTQIPGTMVLHTTPITITGLTATHLFVVPLVVPPNLTPSHPTQENVTIGVAAIPGSAITTARVGIVGKRSGTTVRLDPPSVTVAYQGPIPVLNAAGPPLAVLDVQNRRPGIYYLAPAIKLARGLSLVSLTPPRLRVMITAPPQPRALVQPTATPTATPAPSPTATLRPTPSATAVARRSVALRFNLPWPF